MRIVAFIFLSAIAHSALADDFRGNDWGASISQVKATEKATLSGEQGETLFFTDTVAGIKMNVLYTFSAGRLVGGSYLNKEEHSNKNDYIEDYHKLKGLLEKKYGSPAKDEIVWRNDLFKKDSSHWGTAISVGHLIYRAKWESDRTTVISGLRGDDFDVSHGVTYSERASEKSLKEIDEKKALDKL